MKTIITTVAMLFVSAVLAKSGESASPRVPDCRSVGKSFRDAIKGQRIERVLDLLSKEVTTSPDCACELIKAAIAGYRPKPTARQVTAMVDAAINAAPDRMEEIVNCGIAVAPDSKSGILSKASDYGYTPNPLDYPGIIGEHPGGQWHFIPIVPIIVQPPPVTRVDP